MGGKSAEHWVSMRSGREVLRHLNRRKYRVMPLCISCEDTQIAFIEENDLLTDRTVADKKAKVTRLATPIKAYGVDLGQIKKSKGIVFIALHGKYGEDGRVQGFLDFNEIKYTGSGVLASALGMDKLCFRKVMQAEGIAIPKYVVVKSVEDVRMIEKVLPYPVFVKPNAQGSSVGAGIAHNRKELTTRITEALQYGGLVLVDEYLSGIELTCPILGNDKPYALPVVEIKPIKGEFFDYASKYTESGSQEICPAKISSKLTKQIQATAVKVYQSIGCRGFGRVDFILKGNKPVVLEINTIPGLTPMSLFPKSAQAAGLSYSQLLDKIISYAQED